MVNDMKRFNRDGFTLIELLAVLMLLAIIMGIGSYSIIGIIKDSRQKDYELLIENINSAVEEYYIECKYDDGTTVSCPKLESDGYYYIDLSDLVDNGYLKGNDVAIVVEDGKEKEKSILVNPMDNKKMIGDCKIRYKYNAGEISIEMLGNNSTNSCPDSY